MIDSRKLAASALVSSFAIALSSAAVAAQRSTPRFERGSCDVPINPNYPRDIVRDCGHVAVPEVRGQPNTRTFRLAVVVYRAREPDGAPRCCCCTAVPAVWRCPLPWSELLLPLARKRDVVTYDMRGVGLSEPKLCPDFEDRAAPAFLLPTRAEWEAVTAPLCARA
jgi:hypothetical protein